MIILRILTSIGEPDTEDWNPIWFTSLRTLQEPKVIDLRVMKKHYMFSTILNSNPIKSYFKKGYSSSNYIEKGR